MAAFASHPDQWEFGKTLKNQAARAGHDTTYAPNGPGYTLACKTCGQTTQVQKNNASGDWEAHGGPGTRDQLHFTSH